MPTDKLTNRERRALLDVAKKVHVYKLMQAKGYIRLDLYTMLVSFEFDYFSTLPKNSE